MKKILSISLTILLLASHLSFAVGTHYCGGLAVKTELMLGHKHLDCGMGDMDMVQVSSKSMSSIKGTPCCENRYSTYELDTDFTVTPSLNTINPDFIIAYVHAFLNIPLLTASAYHSFTAYTPPIPKQDFSVLFQTFRI